MGGGDCRDVSRADSVRVCIGRRATVAKVLTSLTQDLGKILTELHKVTPQGDSNFVNGLHVAQVRRVVV